MSEDKRIAEFLTREGFATAAAAYEYYKDMDDCLACKIYRRIDSRSVVCKVNSDVTTWTHHCSHFSPVRYRTLLNRLNKALENQV